MKYRVTNCIARLIFTLLVCVILGATLLCVVPVLPQSVFAVGNTFDDTDIMEDLSNMEIGGKPFNVSDYPFVEGGRTPRILAFSEYCYSFRKSAKSHYGLYVYIYNQQKLNLEEDSVQNKIQVGTKWTMKDDVITVSEYKKFDLKFLSSSKDGLFLKYRIVDSPIEDGTTFFDRVNRDKRRYDISGMELLTKGATTAEEYRIGGTYEFSGYAKGCGMDVDAESTLTSSVTDLEVLELEVSSTYWRNPVKSSGGSLDWFQDELDSVYFSIPNDVIEKYGALNEIHGEYYNYHSNLIMVTTNQDIYDSMTKQKGVYVTGYNSDLYSFYSRKFASGTTAIMRQWSFNPNPNLLERYNRRVFQIPFVFLADGNLDEAVIKSSEVIEYAKSYQGFSTNETVDSKTNGYSQELFIPSPVDGYRNFRIRADETFDLLTGGWDAFMQYGFHFDQYDNVVNRYAETPIKMLTATDLLASDKDLSNNLFVNPADVKEFREYAVSQMALGKTPVLFRYRFDTYYSSKRLLASKNGAAAAETDAFVAQQNISLDFDIIDLTFVKDGVSTVIPVVSNPIDIFNDVTSPPKSDSGWGWLLAVIVMIILLIVFAPILPYVLKFVVWVVTLPFRAIGWLVKSVKKKQ